MSNEPCMCGAEDCSRCYPELSRKNERPIPDKGYRKPYRAADKENEWMDYIEEGYREPRGL